MQDQIKKVVIGSGVTAIGLWAFGNSRSNIVSFSVDSNNANFASVDGVLFSADKKTLICYPGGKKDASYVVPDKVETISTFAFTNSMNLASVTIPASVTSIAGGPAFHGYSMAEIKVAKGNENYTSVGGVLFSADKKTLISYPLKKEASAYTVPDTVTVIASGAFSNSVSLTSVTIPKSVTSIESQAFGFCEKLTSVKILNPDCEIIDYTGDTLGAPGATVVSGYAGSTAEAYAKEFGYTFKSLKLAAPTVKIAQTDGGIKVTWNKVDGAPRYMVYYKENGGGWKKIGTTDKTSYTRAAKNLKAGATYQFAVRCCDSDKKTLLSGYKASNKVKYVPELAAPTVKISQTDGGIKVTWNKVSGSDRYMVYYKQNGGSWQKIGTTTKTSYTRAASKLKNGATYQFAVRCCAADGKTLLSAYKASSKVKYVVELAAPVVKAAQAEGGIKVTWNKVSGSAKYMVYYKQSGGSWQKIGATAKTSYTRAASKLKAGATYQFAVRCCASDGKTMLSGYQASNKLKFTK